MRKRRFNANEKKKPKLSYRQRNPGLGYLNVQRRQYELTPQIDSPDLHVWLLQATNQHGGNDRLRKKQKQEPLLALKLQS